MLGADFNRTFAPGKLMVQALLMVVLMTQAAGAGDDPIVFVDRFEPGPCAPPIPADCDPPVVDTAGLHINEVWIDPIRRGIEDDVLDTPLMPAIELFNGSDTARDVGNVRLETAVQGANAALPAVALPPGAFLTVYFLPSGTSPGDFGLVDDLDFDDGSGSVFGDFGGTPDPQADDLALLEGDQTLRFVAWGDPFDPVSALETAALADGVWTAASRIPRSQATRGESFSLLLDGFYRSAMTTVRGPWAPNAADFITIAWVDQTAGIPQPNQPLQIAPRDGQLLPAAPVTLNWRACPEASAYLIELRDQEGPKATVAQYTSLTNSLTLQAGDLPFNPVYWTVACLFDNNQLRSPFPPTFVFGLAPGSGGGGSDPVELNLTHEYQRKDSGMLCLYDFSDNGGNRIGCAEQTAGQDCPWDGPHQVGSASQVRACGPLTENNCVRASVQMVYNYRTGGTPTLHQDYISYLIFAALNPPGIAEAGDPEGDLGAGRGVPPGPTRAVLAKVLDVAPGTIDIVNGPSFGQIRDWIDEDRPVILFRYWQGRGGHATVVFGYQTTPFAAVLVHDPTDGSNLRYRYSHYTSRGLRSGNPVLAIVPPSTIGTPFGDPPNTEHSGGLFDDFGDGDGVVSFDELNRFSTDPANPDSDYDQVDDQQEVHSYTYGLGPSTIVTRRPDIDLDGFRAELDCNSENDALGDLDGGEDIDGDGGHAGEPNPIGPGETDKFFTGAGKDSLSLNVTPQTGPPGTSFTLTGGTLHGNYGYQVEAVDCLNPKLPGDAIGGGLWPTNSAGNGDDTVFTCPSPGCWILYMDLADDGIWLDPAPPVPAVVACDTSFQINCTCAIDDGDDDSRRIDDSALVLPEFNEIDDLTGIEIRSFTPALIELVAHAQPGSGGQPPIHDWQVIVRIHDQPGSNQPDPSFAGFLWAQLQFDQVGQLLNPPAWQVWSPTGWQPEPIIPSEPTLNEQIHLQPSVDIEIVELSLVSAQPITVAGQAMEISGVRFLTLGQDLSPGNPGPIIDAVPDLQPSPGNPPIGQGFLDDLSCPLD